MIRLRIGFIPPLLTVSLLFIPVTVRAQSFAPGHLAVLRVGNASQTLASSGNSLFLDQYSEAGSLVSSIAIPDTGFQALLLSGTSSSEGGLTRSLDHSLLVLAGYNTNRGAVTGSLSSQSGASVPRALATVDAFGTFNLVDASATLYSSNNIRGAASDGTNNFWTAGNPGGTFYLNPPQAPVQIGPTGGNTRQVKIVAGNLYFSTQAGTAGIYTFPGGGLPTAADSPALLFATGANSQTVGFAINVGATLAYVADQRPTAGGIQKWTNNGSGWGLAYSFSTGAGAFDVAVNFSGVNAILYATTGETSGNRLISISDTGPLSIVKVLATAGANEVFRGLDFVPDLRPIIVQGPQSQTVATGSDVTFVVQAQSHYPMTFQWQKDNADITGASGPSLSLPAVSVSDQGVYRVIVGNTYGAVTSTGATLTVSQTLNAPTITVQPASQTIPLGGTVSFSVTATGTPPLSYQWLFNGTPMPNQANSNLVLVNVSSADQGTYAVSIDNPGGSTNSQNAILTVASPPPSFVAYNVPGSVYSQSFDSLPNPGLTSVNADNPVTIAAVAYGLANPFDFTFPALANSVDPNTGTGLGGLGLSNTMPGWYAVAQASAKFGASGGDQSTGGAISFGLTNSPDASTNRSLGLLATSSTGPTAFGLKLVNQTAATLNAITIHFTGELWRQAAVSKSLTAGYWIDPTATNGFSTNLTARLPNLDVVFANDPFATNPVPVDGTSPLNQLSIGVVNQTIADWPPGGALWLSWQMMDPAGKGQGLAIDDLTFSAKAGQTGSLPQLTIGRSGSSVVLSWPASFAGFQLQANSDLGAPNGWSGVFQSVVVSNGFNQVTIPMSSSLQFYRLKR